MRGENEMLDLIISTARTDTRVLAAYLKGSRANPNAPKDIYRDFDVMYVVTETGSFIRDTSWMNALTSDSASFFVEGFGGGGVPARLAARFAAS